MHVGRQKLDAYTVYLIYRGVGALCFALIYTLMAVYRVNVLHMNPLQLVLVGTVLEASAFLFEVPTGVVADTYSRRLSIIIGTTLVGVGVVVQGSIPLILVMLGVEVILGLGYTFTSGATQAWIAGEVGEERVGRVFLRGAQVSRLGELIGIPLTVGLASIHLSLPIVLGGGLVLALAGFLVLFMPESGFRPTPREERTTWQAMARTLTDGTRVVRRQPVLVTFLGIAALGGMASEGFDRLSEAHFLANFAFPTIGGLTPVIWFGIMSVGSMLLGIGAAEIVRRRVDTTRHGVMSRTLFALTTLQISSVIIFGLAGNFMLALMASWGGSLLHSVIEPMQDAWLVPKIDPKVQATVLSMMGQAGALGQVGGGPVVGAIGLRASLRAAMVVSGAVLSPALLLYARAARQGKTAETQAAISLGARLPREAR